MIHAGKLIKLAISFSCCLLIADTAMAGFSTYSKNWPDDAKVVDEKVEDIQDSRYPAKKKDTKADCAVELEQLPATVSEYNKLYLKFGVNNITSELRSVRNLSEDNFANFDAAKRNDQRTYISWEVAAGTRTKFCRLELEYIYTKIIQYDAVPVVLGRNEDLLSEVSTDAALVNLYYDFDTFSYFKPYLGVTWGISYNTARSTLNGPTLGDGVAQKTHYTNLLAWGVIIGGRIPMFERWHGYVQYRYLDLNRVDFKSYSGGLRMKGTYLLQSVSVGAMYIF